MTHFSNRVLGILLIAAIVVTMGGVFLSVKNLGSPTITGLVVDSSISGKEMGAVEVVKIPAKYLPLDANNEAVISISNSQAFAQQIELTTQGVDATLEETSFRLSPSENRKLLVTLSGEPGEGNIIATLSRLE